MTVDQSSPTPPVIPLDEGWTWKQGRYGGWFALGPVTGHDPEGNDYVAMTEGALEVRYHHDPPPSAVVLAVILANDETAFRRAAVGLAVPRDRDVTAPHFRVERREDDDGESWLSLGILVNGAPKPKTNNPAWNIAVDATHAAFDRILASGYPSLVADNERQAKRIAELESALRKIASMPWSSSDVEGVAHDMQDVATESLFVKKPPNDDAK